MSSFSMSSYHVIYLTVEVLFFFFFSILYQDETESALRTSRKQDDVCNIHLTVLNVVHGESVKVFRELSIYNCKHPM